MWVCDTEEVRYQMVSQLDGKKKNNEGFLGMMLSFPIRSPVSLVEIYNRDHTIRLLYLTPVQDSLPYRKSVSMPRER